MKNLAAEGKSILFMSHKLNEIMAVSDRCTVLRKGKYIGTVETKNTNICLLYTSLGPLYRSDFEGKLFMACTHTRELLTRANSHRLGLEKPDVYKRQPHNRGHSDDR